MKKLRVFIFKNGLMFIPKLNLFLKSTLYKSINFHGKHFAETQIDINIDNFKEQTVLPIIERRRADAKLFGDRLAIVPTTKCLGGCSYCYAKAMRGYDSGYIDSKTLIRSVNRVMGKNGGKSIKDVIVYGGEPAVDPQGMRDLIGTFGKDTFICFVTGMLFDDNTFQELKQTFIDNNNISLCLSIDPLGNDGSYTRGYDFKNDKTTYETLIARAAELINLKPQYTSVRQTITEDAYKFDKTYYDIQALLDNNQDFQMTVELIDQVELSDTVHTYLEQNLAEFFDKGIQIAPAKRFILNEYSEATSLINLYGDCDQLFGRITIGPYGEFHGCPNSPVQTNQYKISDDNDYINTDVIDLLEKRTKLWDKCYECDFVSYCSGFCYIVSPTDSRCKWRIYNILEGIYQTYKDSTEEEIDAMVQENIDALKGKLSVKLIKEK